MTWYQKIMAKSSGASHTWVLRGDIQNDPFFRLVLPGLTAILLVLTATCCDHMWSTLTRQCCLNLLHLSVSLDLCCVCLGIRWNHCAKRHDAGPNWTMSQCENVCPSRNVTDPDSQDTVSCLWTKCFVKDSNLDVVSPLPGGSRPLLSRPPTPWTTVQCQDTGKPGWGHGWGESGLLEIHQIHLCSCRHLLEYHPKNS